MLSRAGTDGIDRSMRNDRWVGSLVRLRHIPEYGIWRVAERDSRGWYGIEPQEDSGKVLASLSGDGKLWVQARDIIRAKQQETLL
jgi:hypothetical protein